MGRAPSQWRDEATWVERLARDQDMIRERLGQERMIVIGQVVGILDDLEAIDFLVVYGRAAREGAEAANDVDLYFEAPYLHEELQRQDAEGATTYHAYGWPVGQLLLNLRAGLGFSFGLVRDGLVFVDRGAYREILAAIDEEGLELALGESPDKPQP